MKKREIAIGLFISLLCIFDFYGISQNDKKYGLPNVVIVTTGGTIAEKNDPETGVLVPSVSGTELIQTIDGLDRLANIEVFEFCNVDSSRMSPQVWSDLSRKVDSILQDPTIDGVVITHGTDTMAEGAYFLDLTLQTEKPVVFVGSMRSASSISPDGPENIYNAVLQVISEKTPHLGVTVTINQYIHSARSVRKTETTNVQTFNSGKWGCLGHIEMGEVQLFRTSSYRQKIPLPTELPNVVLIKTFTGDTGYFVRHAIDAGVQGIVIEAFGAGNVNSHVHEAVQCAIQRGIIVVIATSVCNGSVYPIYGGKGGGGQLQRDGAILAGDLTGAKARILLMLALSQTREVSEIASHFKN